MFIYDKIQFFYLKNIETSHSTQNMRWNLQYDVTSTSALL